MKICPRILTGTLLFSFLLTSLFSSVTQAAIKDDFLINDDAGNNYQGQPVMALDLYGNFVVCWTDRRNRSNDIYIQRFQPDGMPVGGNERVNDDTGDAHQLQPQIASDSNGDFVVVWLDYREGKPHVYAQRYARVGIPLGENFRVDDAARDEYTKTEPVVVKHRQGDFIVAWREVANFQYVYAQQYDKDGELKGENIPVSGISSGKSALNIGIDNDENFYVSFLWTEGAQNRIKIRKYNPAGNLIWQIYPGEENRTSGWEAPALGVRGTGDFAVAWQQRNAANLSDWDIYVQQFDITGSAVGPEFKVSEDPERNQMNPHLSVGNGGTLVVAWEDDRNGNTDIYAQKIDRDGSLHESNFRVNTDTGTADQTNCEVNLKIGNLYYTWTDKRDIYRSSDIYGKIDSWGNPEKITLLSPNGGEYWLVNQNYPVRWNSSNISGKVQISFSPTGELPFTMLDTVAVSDGAWDWKPEAGHISETCRIRLICNDNAAVSDVSDGTFTVAAHARKPRYAAHKIPSIMPLPVLDGLLDDDCWAVAEAESLLFGESWEAPWTNYADNLVTWRAVWSVETNRLYVAVNVRDDIRGTFDNNDPAQTPYRPWYDDSIEFYTDGDNSGGDYQSRYDWAQQWRVSGENIRNLMNFPSAANPGIYTENDFLTGIRLDSTSGYWTCEAAFLIYENYPDDPKYLRAGDEIGWEVRYADSDDENPERNIYTNDHNTGWFYNGPAAINADYLGILTLEKENPAIHLTSPNGEEAVNCAWPITWAAFNTSDKVKIEVQCGGGWQIIESGAPNTGAYAWAIADGFQCGHAKIRISDAANPAVSDESDGYFSIDCSACYEPCLQVESIHGLPGDELVVTIRMDGNPQPLGSLGFEFLYNPAHLKFERSEKGELIQNFQVFEAAENPDGRIKIGAYHTDWLPANSRGELARLTFTVNPCPDGAASPLQIDNLVDDLTGLNVCPGFFTCRAQCLLGDVNMDRILSPGDALCAFRIYLNNETADCQNECAQFSAEVNCDGEITPADGLAIFKAYLNGESLPLQCPEAGLYKTSPENAALSLNQEKSTAKDEIIISLQTDSPQQLRAFGCDILFPAEWLEFEYAAASELTTDWICLAGEQRQTGVIKLGGFTAEPNPNESAGIIARLHFKAKMAQNQPLEFSLANLKDDFANVHFESFIMNAFSSEPGELPEEFALRQNFPNPFNSSTIIEYALPKAAFTRIAIYNLQGEKIRLLVSEKQAAQIHRIHWNGLTDAAKPAPSGIYFVRMLAGEFCEVRRVVLLR